MDLIIGKAETSHALLTLTGAIQPTGAYLQTAGQKAATIRGVFDRLERQHKDFSQRFKSLTTDNGSEFMEYDKLCRSIHGGSRFQVWYCHSYAAWEKGSVENHNRMIRRFFPKGRTSPRSAKKSDSCRPELDEQLSSKNLAMADAERSSGISQHFGNDLAGSSCR